MSASPKFCPKCLKQGQCHDSRQVKDYVRRRYHCECGVTWTTAEFFVSEGDSGDKHKIRRYRDGQAKTAARDLLQRLQNELAK